MAILEVDSVTKRYGGLVAVDVVEVAVQPGEILGIIGPNGAGKTTLFGLISGFIPPTQGDVKFEGQSIRGVAPHLLVGRGLVRSFQIVQTFADMTTREVVTTAALRLRPTGRRTFPGSFQSKRPAGSLPRAFSVQIGLN